jgi:hypothetical protein
MIIVSVSLLQFAVRSTDRYIFCHDYGASVILLQLTVVSCKRMTHLKLYPTAYDKVTRSARGSNFLYSICNPRSFIICFSIFYAIYTIIYWQIRHGGVMEQTLLQVQLQIQLTLLLFSCDALFVMAASSLPYTFVLVIHCLAWLPFLLTANLNIAFE